MNMFTKIVGPVVLVVTAISAQAQQIDTMGVAAVTGNPIPANPGAIGGASHTTARYQAQYEISDLVTIVAEDAFVRLERVLDEGLLQEEPEIADFRQEEQFAVSAN